MKIHAGCGKRYLEGWKNVDVQAIAGARVPDILADLRSIPLPDGCADELMAIHVIEHFYRWEVPAVLAEWRRLLKPGASLVLELPNLESACRNVLAGDTEQMGMWPLYGDPGHKDPYMCHRWGWTPATLQRELEAHGFTKIKHRPPEHHGARVNRDMRIEAKRL